MVQDVSVSETCRTTAMHNMKTYLDVCVEELNSVEYKFRFYC